MALASLQAYWWLIISVLGAALVFLLFVQGGQSLLCSTHHDYRTLMINSLGRKWEFTFTTLVVFGGAFFASFPLFYSTSFGGAYWLWMLILVSFVVQAFSYEFRRKRGNIYGTKFYDGLLLFNGLFGCVMLGVAVGTLFFGAEFTVQKGNILDHAAPVISQWAPTHGLEAMIVPGGLLLGFAVFFLARTLACMYFINNIDGGNGFTQLMRVKTLTNGLVFALLFVAFVVVLLLQPGLRWVDGAFVEVKNIYLQNLLQMWWCLAVLLVGVVMVLYSIFRTALKGNYFKGIWCAGFGTVLVVLVLFWIAGYNDTAYLASTVDPASSLTIANSSSSHFTLTVMSWVSILVPFVLAYIWYVWRKMNNTPLTEKELEQDSHVY
ncbi:MAG: cytochrome d ubiquinol oxidase subunit II [Muribaculaceae bacterium]|nr:cytochrome d ubiquinol oxidase subunit II [Muribaculaceae bacterium]